MEYLLLELLEVEEFFKVIKVPPPRPDLNLIELELEQLDHHRLYIYHNDM